MTDTSSWKFIRIRTLVPIRSHVHRRPSVEVNLDDHDEFVTDKCRLSLTEKNRRNFGFYIKPIRDFKKMKNKKIEVWFKPIKSTPGLCGFWKGYRLPHIKVSGSSSNSALCSVIKYNIIITLFKSQWVQQRTVALLIEETF